MFGPMEIPKSRAKAFSFHFKFLIGPAVVLWERRGVTRYGLAVLEELVQYRSRFFSSAFSFRFGRN
jgi:hypothetical protein